MDSLLGKLGVRFLWILIIINSATRSHFPPGLCLLVEYHFVSDPGPKNDQRPAGNLFANRDTSVELAIHSVSLSFISPYDVIEHRHEDDSSLESFKFAHFAHELLDFTAKLQCSESWENIPLEFHRFSVNSVQSSVLLWIFEPTQLLLPNIIWCWVLIHLSKT